MEQGDVVMLNMYQNIYNWEKQQKSIKKYQMLGNLKKYDKEDYWEQKIGNILFLKIELVTSIQVYTNNELGKITLILIKTCKFSFLWNSTKFPGLNSILYIVVQKPLLWQLIIGEDLTEGTHFLPNQ